MKSVVLAVLLVTACDAKKAEPSGIGRWRFTTTVARDAKRDGICSADTTSTGRPVTWCHTMPPIKAAGRVATIALYFEGHAEDGKLIEIQLGIRGCREDDLDRWLRGAFGPPVETRSTRSYWQNSFMWIGALMPSDPGACRVHLLPLSETSEIERIKQK